MLPSIEKSDLSKKVIEEFFHNLVVSLQMGHSRYLNYFLSADDKRFEERLQQEAGVLTQLMGKIKKNPVTLKELKIKGQEKTKVNFD